MAAVITEPDGQGDAAGQRRLGVESEGGHLHEQRVHRGQHDQRQRRPEGRRRALEAVAERQLDQRLEGEGDGHGDDDRGEQQPPGEPDEDGLAAVATGQVGQGHGVGLEHGVGDTEGDPGGQGRVPRLPGRRAQHGDGEDAAPLRQLHERGAGGEEDAEADGAVGDRDRVGGHSKHREDGDRGEQGGRDDADEDGDHRAALAVRRVQEQDGGDEHAVLQRVAGAPRPGPTEAEGDLEGHRGADAEHEGDEHDRRRARRDDVGGDHGRHRAQHDDDGELEGTPSGEAGAEGPGQSHPLVRRRLGHVPGLDGVAAEGQGQGSEGHDGQRDAEAAVVRRAERTGHDRGQQHERDQLGRLADHAGRHRLADGAVPLDQRPGHPSDPTDRGPAGFSQTSVVAPPLFSFRGVGLVTDGHPRLIDVDLDVGDRAITVIVGASGSGKSTLLRLCNRLEAPSEGTVAFRGEDLATADVRAHRRRVGMLFQRPTPFAGTVLQNLRVADPELSEEAAARLLERVGLDAALLVRPADRLSGGESQRMCLARTLATDPEVLLADEATSSLDPDATRHLERLAVGLRDDGIPVLWVTQEHEQIDRIADHSIRVTKGRVAGA